MQDQVVVERRQAPFAWQEKQALRLIRDYFSGRALVAIRSLYLALTEIVSDHPSWGDTIKTSDLYGASKAILTYSGLTHDAYAPARRALEALRLIQVEEARDDKGYKVGLVIQLLPCPVRPENPLKNKIKLLADVPKKNDLVPAPLIPDSGSRKSLSPETLNPETLIRESGSLIEEGVIIEERVSVEEKETNANAFGQAREDDHEQPQPGPEEGVSPRAQLEESGAPPSEDDKRGEFVAAINADPPQKRVEYLRAICGLVRRMRWYEYVAKERSFDIAQFLARMVNKGFNGSGPPSLNQLDRLLRSLMLAQEIPRPQKDVDKAWPWYTRRVQAIMESTCEVPPFDFRWTYPARGSKTWGELLCPKAVMQP